MHSSEHWPEDIPPAFLPQRVRRRRRIRSIDTAEQTRRQWAVRHDAQAQAAHQRALAALEEAMLEGELEVGDTEAAERWLRARPELLTGD